MHKTFTAVNTIYGLPNVGVVSGVVLLLDVLMCCPADTANGDGVGTTPPTSPVRLNVT